MISPRMTRPALALAALLASGSAWATSNGTEPTRWQLNLHEGVTQTSANAYNAHMIMLWICVVIGVIVFGAMAVAMVKFRKSRGAIADKDFTHSTVLEAIWTTVPILILVGSAIPATRLVMAQYGADRAALSNPVEMTIKVTGYQWMWKYEYIGQDISFISRLDRESDRVRQDRNATQEEIAAVANYLRNVDRPLVIPADTKIRFVITADDVIHAWWVPALGWKQDAIPGVINEAWTEVAQPGIYRGVCAELCGKDHGFMPIVVEVKSKEDYAAWLALEKAKNAPAPAPAALPAAPAGDEQVDDEPGDMPAGDGATEAAPAAAPAAA
jgi:cytochrome c oxidase subunit 2